MKASTKKDLKIPLHIRVAKGRKRGRVENASEAEIKKKNIYAETERFATRFVDRSNVLLPPRARDGLEDTMDGGALDKRGDMGLIAAFTLTAHQSRSTTSCIPASLFLFLSPFLSVSISLPPSFVLAIRKRENRWTVKFDASCRVSPGWNPGREERIYDATSAHITIFSFGSGERDDPVENDC